jgi:hypothetical protein
VGSRPSVPGGGGWSRSCTRDRLTRREEAEQVDRGDAPVVELASDRDLSRGLKRWLRKAGIDRPDRLRDRCNAPGDRFHDLRATAITWMAVRGDAPSSCKAAPDTATTPQRCATTSVEDALGLATVRATGAQRWDVVAVRRRRRQPAERCPAVRLEARSRRLNVVDSERAGNGGPLLLRAEPRSGTMNCAAYYVNSTCLRSMTLLGSPTRPVHVTSFEARPQGRPRCWRAFARVARALADRTSRRCRRASLLPLFVRFALLRVDLREGFPAESSNV